MYRQISVNSTFESCVILCFFVTALSKLHGDAAYGNVYTEELREYCRTSDATRLCQRLGSYVDEVWKPSYELVFEADGSTKPAFVSNLRFQFSLPTDFYRM